MGVDHTYVGPIHCAVFGVHSPRDIDIFGIHEETLVKQPDIFETGSSEQHKTPLVVCYVERRVV